MPRKAHTHRSFVGALSRNTRLPALTRASRKKSSPTSAPSLRGRLSGAPAPTPRPGPPRPLPVWGALPRLAIMRTASCVLQRRVIVLNQAWLPVAVTTVQGALSLLFTTHADTGEPKSRYLDLGSLSLVDGRELLREGGGSAEMVSPTSPLECSSVAAGATAATEAATERIRTPMASLPVPRAIVLSRFTGMPTGKTPRQRRFTRQAMYARDGFACGYCGVEAGPGLRLTLDHVVPVSRGGVSSFENCVSACHACNSRKSARTPHEAGMRLRPGIRLAPPQPGFAASRRLAECARLFKSLVESPSK